MSTPHVSAEEFVIAWQDSGSLAELASKIGASKAWAATRASRLRRRGVVLKRMQKVTSRACMDIEKLKRLADR